MNSSNNNRKSRLKRGTAFGLVASVLLLTVLAGDGCRVVQETAKLPGKTMAAVVPGSKTKQIDPAFFQTELLRYADDFCSRTTSGVDDYVSRVDTVAARSQGLRWKISLESSAVGIATSPNPTANLLDFLALATLTREFLEDRATQVVPRGALDSWLTTSRFAETNAWRLAENILTPEQLEEVRAAIEQWRNNNPKGSDSFFERPQKIASIIRESGEKNSQGGSVLGLVGLDPTAGLDPAIREVTRSRLFAERALFAAQRMPFLIRWQTELLADQVAREEQVTNAIASTERLSRAADSISRTAELLPDRLSSERKAILDSLEAQEGRLRDLSAEVSRTLQAGEKMSTSLNTTLTTFDGLMKRFGVGEPSTTPLDTNSPPFNILDYARTADQVGAMAQQLDVLLKDASGTVDTPALDKRIAQLNALSNQAKADAQSVLNHAFLLLAGLILLIFACALLYRRLAARVTTSVGKP
jgi:hypothetical protein